MTTLSSRRVICRFPYFRSVAGGELRCCRSGTIPTRTTRHKYLPPPAHGGAMGCEVVGCRALEYRWRRMRCSLATIAVTYLVPMPRRHRIGPRFSQVRG